MSDKTKYLPLAQVMRMFKDMPGGRASFEAAYPGILDGSNPDHVVIDPDNGALMIAPPPAVQDEIRAKAIAAQSEMQQRTVNSARMQPLGATTAPPNQAMTKEQMLRVAAQRRQGSTQ